MEKPLEIIEISSKKVLGGCLAVSAVLFAAGWIHPFPAWAVASEVLLAILFLFVFGSIRYRIDKNIISYGAGMIVTATFFPMWWKTSALHAAFSEQGFSAAVPFLFRHFATLKGLDQLVHADTMLFILGLTFFVAVIAQTRLLESVSFKILEKSKGNVVLTVGILAAIVSLASGVLDGVSMIGLMIRTLVIILFLAKAGDAAVIYAVMVSTVVTTVCGMYLAYGEPPNLIMKANLEPHLTNAFFLRYCLPVAVGSYFIVFFNIRKRLKGRTVEMQKMEVLERNIADVRFIQSVKHGEMVLPIEVIDEFRSQLGGKLAGVEKRLREGEDFARALVLEGVPEDVRVRILGHYISEDIAVSLDRHAAAICGNDPDAALRNEDDVRSMFEQAGRDRRRAQLIGLLSFIPFVGLLVAHAVHHEVRLFWASFAGFATAFLGIAAYPKMRKLALKDAAHEYSEYLFLFPLFLSITLLQKTGFFELIAEALKSGVERFGAGHMAYLQFAGCTFLSAMLDNNVVADFAGRAIRGLEVGLIHLFAMAQIAGYAAGGCWTHIGSAQSVVAYSFIRKEVDADFTPFQWIRWMTPVILEIFVLMTFIVYGESFLFNYFGIH